MLLKQKKQNKETQKEQRDERYATHRKEKRKSEGSLSSDRSLFRKSTGIKNRKLKSVSSDNDLLSWDKDPLNPFILPDKFDLCAPSTVYERWDTNDTDFSKSPFDLKKSKSPSVLQKTHEESNNPDEISESYKKVKLYGKGKKKKNSSENSKKGKKKRARIEQSE